MNSIKRSFTKTISVTSGKGGVGKSTLVSNMAIHLGNKGYKVLLLDGDLSLANLDILFSVKTKYNISDILQKNLPLAKCLINVSENVSLLPGGSGLYELEKMTLREKSILLEKISEIEGLYDYLIIDTAPGIDETVLYLNSAAQEISLVLTPDPSSFTDSYALIKVMNKEKKEKRFSIICNMVRNKEEALSLYNRFYTIINQFLLVQLEYKGFVPLDVNLRKAVKSQQLILKVNPFCFSSSSIKNIAERLTGFKGIERTKGGLQFFWRQLLDATQAYG